MRIKDLYPNNYIKNNHRITGISDNSQEIKENMIFVGIKGYTLNGNDFIEEAINNGAKTIITDSFYETNNQKINVIQVNNSKKELANILKKMYFNKFKNLKFIGITGTSGKTTCVSLLYQFLLSNNYNVICFSSNGNYINKTYYPTNNTTSKITTIYQMILDSNIKKGYVILEISSQAISEFRLHGLEFDIVSFTNIDQDHLDYHKNITDYVYTKARLLNQIKNNGLVVFNNDNKYYKLINDLSNNKLYTFGKTKEADFNYEIIESDLTKTLFFINHNLDFYSCKTSLIGEFNIQNITNIFTIITLLNLNIDKYLDFIQNINYIEGRMNIYYFKDRTIIIDYAHTINAVEEALKTIKQNSNNKIKLIIGCGGMRDRSKRPKIGKLACFYADFVYFTEDNSRGENLKRILKEITCDLLSDNYMIIESRFKAIKKAIIDSSPGDIIILMGKGKEKTIWNEIEYSDLEMVLMNMKEEKKDV
ncbi:MAG: UDP-N-acetylmuramoyl-L-alanyl-D-glutamate--2,6-diaminopimelate ligase [Bacilli bacterium]|nr:UDP-N-acetylmuramoyl-L-alanyl-D-glutamate--2,6-diaminopimelate ligase [Bacilli bacterium]